MISHRRPITIAYDMLSLTNSTLLIVDIIRFCTKNLYLIHESHSLFHRKLYICLLVRFHLCPVWSSVLPFNLTYTRMLICFPILSSANLPYILLIFHVPNLMSILCSLGRLFCNKLIFYGEDLLAPRPIPKLQDHPLSVSRDCVFNIFAATIHIWRLSLSSPTWGHAMPWWQETTLP
jgi:hypothetical protein